MPGIDVRIFGVPERMDNIRMNQKILSVPDDKIVIDYGHNGCFWTAQKAWGLYPDEDYILVLQDDVELCDDFLDVCEIMIRNHPDAVIGLYPGQFPRWEHIKRFPFATPYIDTYDIAGPGVIMRSDYIYGCIQSWDPKLRGDDVNIRIWAKNAGVQLLTTIPTTIQHLGGYSSVFAPSRNLGDSSFFLKDPSDVLWDTKKTTSWSDIAKKK